MEYKILYFFLMAVFGFIFFVSMSFFLPKRFHNWAIGLMVLLIFFSNYYLR